MECNIWSRTFAPEQKQASVFAFLCSDRPELCFQTKQWVRRRWQFTVASPCRQGIRMKYETRRELRYGQQIAKHWKRKRRIYSNNFCASFIAAGSSINMAGRRGDTARFDTQYPECYGLTGRDREESRLSSVAVRYFLSRLVHYPHALSPPQNVNIFAYTVDRRRSPLVHDTIYL